MSAAPAHVLVVDDDPVVRDVLLRYLSREGLSAEGAADGVAALSAFEARRPDLVVLDLMLPRLDGFAVFERMRRSHPESAVLMLTARGAEMDRVVGLERGADDYVTKPFSPRELIARVRAVLRRTQAADEPDVASAPVIDHGPLSVDPAARCATIDGARLALTPKEFDLLAFLAANPGVAFSRTELLDHVWDVAYDGDASTVTVHVRRLREKIEHDPSHPELLVTVWGAGYRFEPWREGSA